jgi:chemotaxis protein MotA
MGMIGTVMGLVQVLSHMSDAEHLTAAISVAFIATLYGVVFANLIFLPIANQLKRDLRRQKVFKQIIIDGIVMIAGGENANNLRNKLSLYYQTFPKCDKKYKEGING